MLDTLLEGLGYVGDALDKPGRAVRGLLGGRPQEALAALPFSDTLGITDPRDKVSGLDLLRSLGVDAGDGFLGGALGTGVEIGLNPLTYLGGLGLGRAGAAAASKAASPLLQAAAKAEPVLAEAAPALEVGSSGSGSFFRTLRGLRNEFPVMKDVHLPPGATEPASRLIGGHDLVDPAVLSRQANRLVDWDRVGGFYNPKRNVAAVKMGQGPGTLRHEVIHGLIRNAGLMGQVDELPLMMRLPARLQQSSSPFVQGLGGIADELAAHSLSQRGTMNQLGAGLKFLTGASPLYYDQIAHYSPLAAKLYWSGQFAPVAGAGVAGAGAAGGLGLLGYLLRGGSPPPEEE